MSIALAPSNGLISFVPQTLFHKPFKDRIRFAGFQRTSGHGSRSTAGGTGGRTTPEIASNRADGRPGGTAYGCACGRVPGDPGAAVFPGAKVNGQLNAFIRVGLGDLLSDILKMGIGIKYRPLRRTGHCCHKYRDQN